MGQEGSEGCLISEIGHGLDEHSFLAQRCIALDYGCWNVRDLAVGSSCVVLARFWMNDDWKPLPLSF
jgi:hypothetical protein